MYFCRKADPESKGKVENVVQYIKKNFLYNRLYSDLETLNTKAIAWLVRTANHLVNNYTKKSPESVFMIVKEHLGPYTPITIENIEIRMYHVRKYNTVNYKSNFYTIPMGTYPGTWSLVLVKEKDATIEMSSLNDVPICSHLFFYLKGQPISNTNHKEILPGAWMK